MPEFFTDPAVVFIALLGGILPATFWLWFWLKEDKLHPEPRGLIMLAFLVGMLATAIAFPIEKFIVEHVATDNVSLLFLWAVVEECLKFIGIFFVAIRTKYFDEPIDAVMYLITIALGFAALENAMFLFTPLNQGDGLASLILGQFRFIGATLLHVGASGIVGVAMAFAFYKPWQVRAVVTMLALSLAIALHTLFNFSIITSGGEYLYGVFATLWAFILGILLACEKIKRMAPRSHVAYPHTGHPATVLRRSIRSS